jgi:hypothetical protein
MVKLPDFEDQCVIARLKTNTEKNPILYVWNIVCSAKLPSWFCVFAKSILPNRWVYIPQSTLTLQQLTKLPTPVCQNCEVHIANSPSPHHLCELPECTLKLPNFKQTSIIPCTYIVYVLQSKKLSKPRSKRSPHSSLAFTSCLRVKHFSPPTKKKAGK